MGVEEGVNKHKSEGKFIFRRLGKEEYKDEGSCESCPRRIVVKRFEEAFIFFSKEIHVTVSYVSKGWGWVTEVITEAFNFKKCFELSPIGPERAILYTNNEKVTESMMHKEGIVERGTMISFNRWNTQTQTLESKWFRRRGIWVNVIGLSLHLWSLENAVA